MNEIKTKISAIAAMAENRVIGNNNEIPWHIPEDFAHFKRTTMGKPMIMGRKTFESLPGVLKGRTHIVISRGGFEHAEAQSVTSIEDAVTLAKEIAEKDGQDEIFIIGGGEIYRQTLPMLDRLYLTIVHLQPEGDTQFPDFDRDDWMTMSEEKHDGNPAFTFLTLGRI